MSAPDDGEMGDTSLEKIPTASSPTAETPELDGSTPPADTGHLWEEANKALGRLLATKSSINAHWQKLVWELSMALHQNDSETTESVKEAKAICTHSSWRAVTLCSTTIKDAKATCACSTQEAEALCSTAIKEAETICTCSTQEAKTLWSMTIREAEAQGASQADSLQ